MCARTRSQTPVWLLSALLLTPFAGVSPGTARAAEPAATASAADGGKVTRLDAELLRRRGGEWVIVSLSKHDPEVASSAPGEVPAPGSADQAGVQAALDEYQRAMESRDTARLARVWIMNPAEQAHVQRFLDESESIHVSIGDPEVRVDGDHASMHFDQEIVVSRRSWLSRNLSPSKWRNLFASDEVGSWELEDVLEHD